MAGAAFFVAGIVFDAWLKLTGRPTASSVWWKLYYRHRGLRVGLTVAWVGLTHHLLWGCPRDKRGTQRRLRATPNDSSPYRARSESPV